MLLILIVCLVVMLMLVVRFVDIRTQLALNALLVPMASICIKEYALLPVLLVITTQLLHKLALVVRPTALIALHQDVLHVSLGWS